MQATTTLPADYFQQATLDLSKSRKALVGAVGCGIVLLIAVGWLAVQFTRLLRPGALAGIGFGGLMSTAPEGGTSITLPLVDAVVALVLVMLVHELVHGMFYWRFAGGRPRFGIKGLGVYVAAPPEVYFPRNQYLIVGIAPFVLLTLVGLLLITIAPLVVLPIVILFIAFNAAGAGGDLVMVACLLSYSAHALIQDSGTSVVVYGPGESRSAD